MRNKFAFAIAQRRISLLGFFRLRESQDAIIIISGCESRGRCISDLTAYYLISECVWHDDVKTEVVRVERTRGLLRNPLYLQFFNRNKNTCDTN
jgi:hypothetical protein